MQAKRSCATRTLQQLLKNEDLVDDSSYGNGSEFDDDIENDGDDLIIDSQ